MRLRSALLLGLPFLVRLACWLELRDVPLFRLPLLDARIYHEMALRLANGTFERHEPFWQPPLYPYILGLLYKLGSASPDLVRLLQAVIGSVSCWLVFRLGQRIHNARAAWISWGIVALYGPLILFDLQLLNVNLAIFLLLTGLNWLAEAADRGTAPEERVRRVRRISLREEWRWAAAGLALGLACITVATSVVLLPLIGIWVFRRVRPEPHGSEESGRPAGREERRSRLVQAALFLTAAALPILVVTAGNLAVSGEPVLISYNGGINFWIGNNPEYERTVALRPGRAWIALNEEPRRAGVTGYGATSTWWLQRSLSWIASDPGAWIALLLHKSRLFLQAYEIPRNQEIYPFRPDSITLRPLLWVHGIGFPFGILLPLAAGGIFSLLRHWPRARPRRSFVALVAWIALALSATVVLFFVTERYRLPVVPLLALMAGGGLALWIEEWRRQARRRLIAPALVVLAVAVLANTGLPAMPRLFNSDAYSDLGLFHQGTGALEDAVRAYEQALERDPENLDAANNLGGILLGQGRVDAAAALFRKILVAYPDDPGANLNLGSVYFHKGEPYRAGMYYLRVYRQDPNAPHAADNLRGLEQVLKGQESERLLRDPEALLDSLERLYRSEPQNEFLRMRLVRLLGQRGEEERARRIEGL